MATALTDVLRGLMAQVGRQADASATLAGGLVVRVTRSTLGWRITAERVHVMPAEHELATLERAATATSGKVIGRGDEQQGLLMRRWFELARW